MTESARGLVIIGSGPSGESAAEAYRAAGGRGPVRLLSADKTAPYERPPLSKELLQGEIEAIETAMHDPAFYLGHGVELQLGTRVARLDPSERVVVTDAGAQIAFDHCVIATGSRATRPQLPGAGADGVYTLRSLADATALVQRAQRASTALVVGSGFIGCEAAASLARRGLDVTLVSDEQLPQQGRLGTWTGERIASWLREDGVQAIMGRSLAEIDASGTALQAMLSDGTVLAADLILMAAGAQPQVELASVAGLSTAEGRIRVDAAMRTSAPGILAAGDVVHAHNDAAGRALSVEHWGDAMRMGEIAGRTAAGMTDNWAQAPGFWSTIGDRTLKYAAWGDGWDSATQEEHSPDSFTVWYRRGSDVVGVLTCEADEDYDRGIELLERG